MTNSTLIKQLFFTLLLVAGMSLYSSCDSCSRPDPASEGTNDAMDANGDTRGSESPDDNENSGSTEGTGSNSGATHDGNASTSIQATTPETASGKTNQNNAVTTNTEKKLAEEEITNRVENSNASNAVDSKGNPIRSSGSSGTGQGTGTGSTGNNSKVTTKADQKS
jgi:hypothetical protein